MGSLAATVVAVLNGAHLVRTHDVARASEAVVHQVVVEAGPAAHAEQLRAISETWATECAEDRSLEPLDR